MPTYSHESQIHENAFQETAECKTCFSPVAKQIQNWFSNQWDQIYSKYRNTGDKPENIESEDKLRFETTFGDKPNTYTNIGDKPNIHIQTLRQDDTGLTGGTSSQKYNNTYI